MQIFAVVGAGAELSVEYLVVGGGAAGGSSNSFGGGGGAGKVSTATSVLQPSQNYVVTIGAGGTGTAATGTGAVGSTSSITGIVTSAGGSGGIGVSSSNNAGGASGNSKTGGTGASDGKITYSNGLGDLFVVDTQNKTATINGTTVDLGVTAQRVSGVDRSIWSSVNAPQQEVR
jgi:hypothetical protein